MTRTSTVTLVIAIFVSSMIFLSLAVSHAAEKAPDDDAFLLGCIWTGDHKRTVCGEFTTRASCEREGRAAVASGELSKFECISAVTIDWGALFDGVFRSIFEEPTAAGPGRSDQPTFGRQMPVRIAAPDRAYLQRLFPNTVPMVAGPSAPDPKLWHPGQAYQGSVAPRLASATDGMGAATAPHLSAHCTDEWLTAGAAVVLDVSRRPRVLHEASPPAPVPAG
jgi:hypothetical protein